MQSPGLFSRVYLKGRRVGGFVLLSRLGFISSDRLEGHKEELLDLVVPLGGSYPAWVLASLESVSISRQQWWFDGDNDNDYADDGQDFVNDVETHP